MTMNVPPMHILKTQQFSRPWLDAFFKRVTDIKRDFTSPTDKVRMNRLEFRQRLSGRLFFSVFAEPSTRTRFSFEAAAHHLGMVSGVTSENAADFSSLIKGETPEHTIRVLCGYYPDVIVWRHKMDGVINRIAPIATECGVPLINAGEGTLQHPTQSLVDEYTIQEHFGKLDYLTVVIGGDLMYGRTVKSLAYLLSKSSGIRLCFVSPLELRMDAGVRAHLREHNVWYQEISVQTEGGLNTVIAEADVVYWTRTQNERIADPEIRQAVESSSSLYRITERQIEVMKPNAILLHPMPINGEITAAAEKSPQAHYFEQAGNGLFVRMALFLEIFDRTRV